MAPDARRITPPPLTAATALFLDVDGTLLDIAPTPDAVIVPHGLLDTLRRLREALDGAVALLSGRRQSELRRLFRDSGLIFVGEHGATASVPLPALEALRGERPPPGLITALRRFAARHPDALLEIKGHGAALHVRRAPAAAPAARRLVLALAEAYRDRARLIRGKAVFEFVSSGVSKGRALEALLAETPFRGRTPYVIGDDVTDEDAFAAARRLGGAAVRVGPAELRGASSAANYSLASPAQVRKWLRGAADSLSQIDRDADGLRNFLGARPS